jgi:hypothetical protein
MAGVMVGRRGGRAFDGCAAAACFASSRAVGVRGAAAGGEMHVRTGYAFYAVRMRVERMWFHGYGMVQIGLRHCVSSDVVPCCNDQGSLKRVGERRVQ